jgi:hypothetical protein
MFLGVSGVWLMPHDRARSSGGASPTSGGSHRSSSHAPESFEDPPKHPPQVRLLLRREAASQLLRQGTGVHGHCVDDDQSAALCEAVCMHGN